MFLLFTILVVSFIWSRTNTYYFKDNLSPFNVLFFIWVLPFISQFYELSSLQNGIGIIPMIILLLTTSVMVFTLLTYPSTNPIETFSSPSLKGVWCRQTRVTFDRLLWFSFILSGVALSAKIYAEFSNGIPLFIYIESIDSSAMLHRTGKDSKLQILAQSLSIGGMLGWYCWLKVSNRIIFRVTALLIALIPLIVGVLKVSKSDIIEPLFLYVLIYYYTQSKPLRISYIKIIFSAFAILFIIFWLTEIRLIGQGSLTSYADAIEFKTGMHPLLRDIFALPYGYMAINFENFSRYVEMSNYDLRLGTSMFRPFFSIFMQGHIPDELLHGVDLHEIIPAANAGTFLRDLYIEGGVLLCLIGAFWNTFLIQWVYSRFRERQDDISMVIYVVLLFPWATIFFTNAFSVLTIYTNLFLAAAILFISRTHENKKFSYLNE